ncbi:MAG: PIN domain-containing protein [Nanoarchaeota archaeon]|nr:PIN domain-containing protein [Nanoarchaeota archaeon]
MTNDKTLIILDTNSLVEGENHNHVFHNVLSSNSVFKQLNEFLVKNNLKDKIIFGIPEIVFQEHHYQRQKKFERDLDLLKEKVKQFEAMDLLDHGKLDIKFKEGFNYKEFLLELLNKSKEFKILKIPHKKKLNIYEEILEKAINHRLPFNDGGNKNFKDALIWGCIGCQNFRDYAWVIFLTLNPKDFPKNNDFDEINKISESTGKIIHILGSVDEVKEDLQKVYMFKDKELKNWILNNQETFAEKIFNWIVEEDGIPFDKFKLIKPCERIQEVTNKDLEDIGIIPSPARDGTIINLGSLRFISVEFEGTLDKTESYLGEVLYDIDVKEVLHVRWDIN